MRSRGRLIVVSLALVGVAASLTARQTPGQPGQARQARPAVSDLAPMFAAGDAAANIALRRAGDRVVIRWVARRSGTMKVLYVRVKTSGRGYASGTTGIMHASTHPVLPDGRPWISRVLGRSVLSPGRNQWGGSVALRMDMRVRAGQEFATVIRNDARDPARNYFSANFLYVDGGVAGANGRNERRRNVRDEYYGLDPRELVGYSSDGGRSWRLPGAPYGSRGGRSFLPTYIQQYSDGVADGQFYYWSAPVSGRVTMVYPDVPAVWSITHVGAYTHGAGAADVVVAVDGARRASAELSGTGFLLARVPRIDVAKGSTVTVTTTAGRAGLALSQQFADSVWARLVGLGPRYRWYLQGRPQTAVPVYPLPRPPAVTG